MKKVILSLIVFGGLLFTSCKDEKKADMSKDAKMETPAAMEEAKPDKMDETKSGTMNDTKPAATATMEKEHACTGKCKEANHMYAHGEKGHTCTAECGKM